MPKAMVRIYLADGQFKSLVLDQNVNCEEAVATIIEKLETTSTNKWDDCLLFQSLDFGKEIIELNAVDCPYTIAQWWGESSDSNRFVFKRASEPLKKGIPGFEKYKSSRAERRSTNPIKGKRSPSTIAHNPSNNYQPQDTSDSFMVQQGAPPMQPPPPPRDNTYSSGGASAAPPTAQNKAAMMGGFNPLAPNTSGPHRPARPPPQPSADHHQDTNTAARPPMERVPMPGFGGNVGGGMDPNALQEKIKNMKAQQNVQIESVMAWINMNLQVKSLTINDLTKDMKSGVALASLCEILTKKPLHFNANPKSDMQMRDNLEASFKAFETAGVKATGVAPNDFLTGNQRAILGYLLLLVKKFKDARTSKRFSRVLTSSGPLITGRTSGSFSPNAPSSPGMGKPNNPPVKQSNPNVGRQMPTPPGVPAKKASAPPVPKAAPSLVAAPKKSSLPPVPGPPTKKSSLPPVPLPPSKEDQDLNSFMDSLVVSLDSTTQGNDEWGTETNNDSYDYSQSNDQNSWETTNDYNYGNESYDYSGGNSTSYDSGYDYNNADSYDSGAASYDYSADNNASYDSGFKADNGAIEEDPDLFDTFNELEDMLSEMANELGVFDA
eukprot:TRINITY_DN5931_c0_g1_i1.p1 TRINITY_DN5931_c0_g1~~TRINITY_DN5931_c0_g1_i1.p1  ORF type:complete len:607 (-),score=187.72 TRINITY_DN5931_c0_g1_i1:109-1929(-)